MVNYKIAKLVYASQSLGSSIDPVVGESEISIQSLKLSFPYKKTYHSYLEAITALDKIIASGHFMIVKVNSKNT